jgi:hypothetical protein
MKQTDVAATVRKRSSVAGAISGFYGKLSARWISWRGHRSGFKFRLDNGAPATFYRLDNPRAEEVLDTFIGSLHDDPVLTKVYGTGFTVSSQHQKEDGTIEVDIEGEKICLLYLDFRNKTIFQDGPPKFLKSALLLVLAADAVVFKGTLYSMHNSPALKYAVEHNLRPEISTLLCLEVKK